MEMIHGNIWDQECDALCVTTNMIVKHDGSLVMGGGLALQAAQRFPQLPLYYGYYYSQWKYLTPADRDTFQMCYAYDPPEGPSVVGFPTKYDYRDPSSLPLIMQSCRGLKVLADERKWKRVMLTDVGCGLGGLKWERVEPILDTFLDERFIVITPK